MKKLVSALLSLVMLLALTAPALAAGSPAPESAYEYSEEVQTWLDTHPLASLSFHSGIDTYVAEEWGYDSVAQMAEDWGESEQYIRSMLTEEWVLTQIWQEERAKELQRLKESLGGVPGQLGVMLNGAYIPFPDAVPESVGGRIMVPYRALMEALGGDVAYDAAAGTVSCILDGTTLSLKLGESTLTIDENGTVSTLEMDCAAYAQNNRTYVPVRFISQAFGYDVLWDQTFETAVLLDRKGIIEGIDEQFAILNRALSALTADESQAYQSTGAVTADLTVFNSIDGDKTYRLTADASGVTRGASGQVSMTMDLSALGEMIDLETLLTADPYYEITEEERALAEQLLNSLGDLSFDYIVNAEEKMIYLRAPLLGMFEEAFADGWLAWREEEFGEAFDLKDLTVGGLLYEIGMAGVNTDDMMYGNTPVYAWSSLNDFAEQLAAVLGDDCFTHTDRGDAFALDLSSLGLEEEYNPFSVLEFTFTVADSGAVTGSFQMEVSMEALFDLTGWTGEIGGTVCVCSGEFAFGQSESSLTMDFHLKNVFRLELESTGTSSPSSVDPVFAPPEGDAVTYMEDGLYLME